MPLGTFAGWNRYAPPYPDGELADRDGSFLAFAETSQSRGADPRASLDERYGCAYADRLVAAAEALMQDRLLLAEDVERYRTAARAAPATA